MRWASSRHRPHSTRIRRFLGGPILPTNTNTSPLTHISSPSDHRPPLHGATRGGANRSRQGGPHKPPEHCGSNWETSPNEEEAWSSIRVTHSSPRHRRCPRSGNLEV